MKTLVLYSAIVFGMSVAPAVAQVCNGTNFPTPLGSLSNKIPGPPSPTSTAAIRYTFGNDVTSDCDSDAGNGGVAQSVTQVIVRPSCNFISGACVNDAGGSDANPLTPAVEFLSVDATTCTGGLANITVDSSDLFSVKLNFTVPLNLPPNSSCSVDVTLHVRESGDATTPSTVAQQYSTDGVCLCSPELNSAGTTSSQLFLTCPPCGVNFCAPEHCNPATFQCVLDPTPDCSNPDNDLCTSGSCDPAANNGNGACVNGPPTVCNDNNACTTDSCNSATGACVFAASSCDPAPSCGVTPGGGLPRPVTLRFEKHPELGNVVVTWDAEPGTVYDVVRGTMSDLIDGGLPRGATCRANDIPGPPTPGTASFSDLLSDVCTADPLRGCWYIVRAQNACGTGPWSSSPLDSAIFTGTCAPDCACPDDNSACTVDGCDASNACHHYCSN